MTTAPEVMARLRQALDAMPDGALVPVAWVRDHLDPLDAGVDPTVDDVAALLNRAPSTVRGWCRDGTLPGAYRMQGREWRIPRAALETLREDGPRQNRRAVRNRPADLGRWRRHVGAGEGVR